MRCNWLYGCMLQPYSASALSQPHSVRYSTYSTIQRIQRVYSIQPYSLYTIHPHTLPLWVSPRVAKRKNAFGGHLERFPRASARSSSEQPCKFLIAAQLHGDATEVGEKRSDVDISMGKKKEVRQALLKHGGILMQCAVMSASKGRGHEQDAFREI